MSDLLKTSIADAKAVREAALANARSFLEEQFNSSLQNMFTQKLSEELNEDDDLEDLDAMLNSTDDETGDQPAVQPTSDQMPSTEQPAPEVPEAPAAQPVPAEQPTQEPESDEEITNEELDEILKELSSETVDEEMGNEDEEMDVSSEDEEEIDLNELLNELENTSYSDINEESETSDDFETIAEGSHEDEEDEDEMNEDVTIEEMANALVSINEENKKLKSSLKQHIDTIHELKKVLSETNLLNAKLLYTNKLFKGKSLTESQKLKVIDTFDLTKSIREVKLAYSVLAESFNFGGSVVKEKKTKNTTAQRITEGLASKPVKSTAPIVEPQVDEMASRLQKLAGIKK